MADESNREETLSQSGLYSPLLISLQCTGVAIRNQSVVGGCGIHKPPVYINESLPNRTPLCMSR